MKKREKKQIKTAVIILCFNRNLSTMIPFALQTIETFTAVSVIERVIFFCSLSVNFCLIRNLHNEQPRKSTSPNFSRLAMNTLSSPSETTQYVPGRKRHFSRWLLTCFLTRTWIIVIQSLVLSHPRKGSCLDVVKEMKPLASVNKQFPISDCPEECSFRVNFSALPSFYGI